MRFELHILLAAATCLLPAFSVTTFAANKTWSGAAGTAWNTPANWIGNKVPGNGDNVFIPGGAPNYPVITSNVSARNVTINSSGTGATLTMVSGTAGFARITVNASGLLTVSSGLLNTSGMDVNGLAQVNGGIVTASDDVWINSGGVLIQNGGIVHLNATTGNAASDNLRINAGGNYNQFSGTLNIKDLLAGAGTFTQNGNAAVLNVERHWQMGAGSTFQSVTGTVQFRGNGNQSNFAAGTRQFHNLYVLSGNPGFGNVAASSIPVSGNFANNNTALTTSANATFVFNGSGNQYVSSATTGTVSTMGNVQVSKTGGILFIQSNLHVSGDVTITNSVVDMGSFVFNRSTAGGGFSLSSGSQLTLTGSSGGQTGSNFPSNFTSYTLGVTSTVIYGGGNQTLAPVIYGNVLLTSSGGASVKTTLTTPLSITGSLVTSLGSGVSNQFLPAANVTVAGLLQVGTGTVYGSGSHIHSIGGDLLNNGIITSAGSQFVFNGTSDQTVHTGSPLDQVTLNNTGGAILLVNNLTVNAALVFTSGNINTGPGYVVLGPNATLSGASQTTGWVNGNLRYEINSGSGITKRFEVGDDFYYAPAHVVFSSVLSAGNISLETIAGDHPQISGSLINPVKSINRYWSFSNSGVGFSTCDIFFAWPLSDVDPGSTSLFFSVGTYNGTWDTLAVTSPLPGSIQALGAVELTEFAIGELCIPATAGTWTGAIDSDWNTAGNWQCDMVPGPGMNVLIASGLSQYPVIGSGTAAMNNLTIQSGASLTVVSGSLQISGTVINAGQLDAVSGTVEFNGVVPQQIASGLFVSDQIGNLIINNAAGVTLGGPLGVSGRVVPQSGTLYSGGLLTLLATSVQSALISGSGSGSVNGPVTMQQYVGTGYGYKYVSSPFQNATVAGLSDETDLGAAFPSVYRYDENRTSSGWISYTDPGGALNPMHGYAVQFGTGSSPVVFDLTGEVNDGPVSLSLSNHNHPYTLGFNLVGNPYPSPVDWDQSSGWNRVNIDDAIYFFNSGSGDPYGGTYGSYINGISSNGSAGNIIPSMQGFFVHVSDGAYPVMGSLSVTNTARTNDLVTGYNRNGNSDDRPMIRLEAGYSVPAAQTDALVVYFDPEAAFTFEANTDALKLMNTDAGIPNIYSFTPDGTSRLSINAMPVTVLEDVSVSLGIKVEKDGWVTFVASGIRQVPEHVFVYLGDDKQRINHDLRRDAVFKVWLAKGDHASRFRLQLSPRELPSVYDSDYFGVYGSGQVVFYYVNLPQGESGKLVISDITGRKVFEETYTGSGRHEQRLAVSSGLYVASFYSKGNVYSEKIHLCGKQ